MSSVIVAVIAAIVVAVFTSWALGSSSYINPAFCYFVPIEGTTIECSKIKDTLNFTSSDSSVLITGDSSLNVLDFMATGLASEESKPSTIECSGTDKLRAYNFTLNTWTCGSDESASGGFAFVVKPTNEIVNNSAILQEDDHLTLPLDANSKYQVIVNLFILSGSTPDFKYDFLTPTDADCYRTDGTFTSAGQIVTETCNTLNVIQTTGGVAGVSIFMRISTSGAGDLTFRWAQNTQNASDTYVTYGSAMYAYKA